jgi:hypothetical protein
MNLAFSSISGDVQQITKRVLKEENTSVMYYKATN